MYENISGEAFKKLMTINKRRYREKGVEVFDILLEGERFIKQAIAFSVAIKALYVNEDKLQDYQALIHLVSCPIYTLYEHQAHRLTSTMQEQGVFAQVSFETKELTDFNRLLYLNDISDPGNLGGILRSASAFGIDGVVMDEKCVDLSNSKLVRSSMGAVFSVPMLRVKKDWLAQREEKIFVCHMQTDRDCVSINDFKFPDEPYILVIGSEAHGVSKYISELNHTKIYIPMHGDMESLNVSVVAGIFLNKMSKK